MCQCQQEPRHIGRRADRLSCRAPANKNRSLQKETAACKQKPLPAKRNRRLQIKTAACKRERPPLVTWRRGHLSVGRLSVGRLSVGRLSVDRCQLVVCQLVSGRLSFDFWPLLSVSPGCPGRPRARGAVPHSVRLLLRRAAAAAAAIAAGLRRHPPRPRRRHRRPSKVVVVVIVVGGRRRSRRRRRRARCAPVTGWRCQPAAATLATPRARGGGGA